MSREWIWPQLHPSEFYNDPNNLVPMSRAENSAKGGDGRYADTAPGPRYSN